MHFISHNNLIYISGIVCTHLLKMLRSFSEWGNNLTITSLFLSLFHTQYAIVWPPRSPDFCTLNLGPILKNIIGNYGDISLQYAQSVWTTPLAFRIFRMNTRLKFEVKQMKIFKKSVPLALYFTCLQFS